MVLKTNENKIIDGIDPEKIETLFSTQKLGLEIQGNKKSDYTYFFGLSWNAHSQNDSLRVYDLKSEYLVNPIGLDVKTPRLTWKIRDQRRGAVQKIKLQNLCRN